MVEEGPVADLHGTQVIPRLVVADATPLLSHVSRHVRNRILGGFGFQEKVLHVIVVIAVGGRCSAPLR
jgi:hypothetical protein